MLAQGRRIQSAREPHSCHRSNFQGAVPVIDAAIAAADPSVENAEAPRSWAPAIINPAVPNAVRVSTSSLARSLPRAFPIHQLSEIINRVSRNPNGTAGLVAVCLACTGASLGLAGGSRDCCIDCKTSCNSDDRIQFPRVRIPELRVRRTVCKADSAQQACANDPAFRHPAADRGCQGARLACTMSRIRQSLQYPRSTPARIAHATPAVPFASTRMQAGNRPFLEFEPEMSFIRFPGFSGELELLTSNPGLARSVRNRRSGGKAAAVVLAAGTGSRVGGAIPKQYRQIGGQPLAAHSIRTFLESQAISRCIVVINVDHRSIYDELILPIFAERCQVVAGGASRTESVACALEHLAGADVNHVLIHDGARPFLTVKLITALLDELVSSDAVVPAIPVADALWKACDSHLHSTVSRQGLVRTQTPQAFAFDEILTAYRQRTGDTHDCAAIASDSGMKVTCIAGETDNFKITHEDDFLRAEERLRRHGETRIGQGVDAHRLCGGESMMLCGIEIADGLSLQGHSDADVGLHAICDALYGAIGEGDIGAWFPPTDKSLANCASSVFLRHAASRVAARGYAIVNVDVTLVCEFPRIRPHVDSMRDSIAGMLALGSDRISVKATTTEGMGFTGRREGISALATVAVRGPCQGS